MRRLTSLLLLLLIPATALAGESQSPNRVGGVIVNYVYAAQFGLGGYRLDEVRVQVLTLPLRYGFDVTDPLRDEGTWRVKLGLPIKYGRYRLEATTDEGDEINETQETIALVPEIELEIPLAVGWTFKPKASFGVARAFEDESDWIYIYGIGARHRYELPVGSFTLLAGNALFWAGNATFTGTGKEAFGTFKTGLGARHALGFTIRGWAPDLEAFIVHHNFFPSAEFARFDGETLRVRNQFEIGLSLGRVGPWKLWVWRNPRIGVSFRFGDGLQGIRIHKGFPF